MARISKKETPMADFVKALFVQRKIAGGNKWVRADVDLVKRGDLTALSPRGHTPGRGRTWDTAEGEVYDDVVFLNEWPAEWPIIGIHG